MEKKPLCSFSGCDRNSRNAGLCSGHYEQRRRGKDLRPLSGKALCLNYRFWAKVDSSDILGCWAWKGARVQDGYGQFRGGSSGKAIAAHRYAYEMLVGEVQPGMELDHLCRNRICVNPLHVEAVTHRENILRGVSPPSRNAAKTECLKGHPLSATNTYIHTTTGSRVCRTCANDRERMYYSERKRTPIRAYTRFVDHVSC